MARPTKQGIDYFPVDVQFDDKIELLIAERGGISVSVLLTTWQLIYQNEGYYIEYSKDLLLLIKRRLMIEFGQIENIINTAIDRNIFDKSLFKKHKILTSKAIQKRYFIASIKKKSVNVDGNYICCGVSVGINSINVVGNATNVKEEVEEEEELIAFDIFWKDYPLKKGKSEALKKWDSYNNETRQKAIDYLPHYVSSIKDKNFLKYGSTYINQKVWEDEIEPEDVYYYE